MENPSLLSLICWEGWIKAKDVDAYISAAQMTGNSEVIAMMLDYQTNKLTVKQKNQVEKNKERQEDAVFNRMVARKEKAGRNLEELHIPGSVTAIDGFLFFGCWDKKITTYAPAGSYAEAYAKEKDIDYRG